MSQEKKKKKQLLWKCFLNVKQKFIIEIKKLQILQKRERARTTSTTFLHYLKEKEKNVGSSFYLS